MTTALPVFTRVEVKTLCGLYDLTSKACLEYELLGPSEQTQRNRELAVKGCNFRWFVKGARP